MKKIEPLVEPDLAPLTPSPEKGVGGMGEAPKSAASTGCWAFFKAGTSPTTSCQFLGTVYLPIPLRRAPHGPPTRRTTGIMSALISAPFFGQFLDAPQAAPWAPQGQKCYKNIRFFNNFENGPGRFWARFGLQKGPKKAPKNSTFSHFGPPGGPQGA